jgi:MFS family permease
MASAPRPRLVTGPFLIVATATLAYFVADGITLPVTPRYVVGPLGGDATAAGIAIGSFSFSAVFLRPWTGRLADRRGRRPLLVAGSAIFALAMVGHLVAVSLPVLVLLRLLMGVGEAFMFVAALAAISDLAPDERRGEAMSFFSLSLYLGLAFGPLIGEVLLGDGRYPLVWLAAAAFAGVSALLGLRVPETRPPPEDTPPEDAARGWRRFIHPAGLLPGAVILLGGLGFAGFLTFVALHSDAMHMGGSRFVFLLYAGIVLSVRLFGARLPDILGGRRASTIALTLGMVGLATIGAWTTPLGLYVGSAIFALGTGFAFPALSKLTVEGAPASERGAVLGTFTAFLDIAFGMGPVALGAIAAAGGYPLAFLAGSALSLGGLVLLLSSRLGAPAPAGRLPASTQAET